VIKLVKAQQAWCSPSFERVVKEELQRIDPGQLPLQQGLSQSSYVSDSKISVVILDVAERTDSLRVKAGVNYAGVIAGSCCSDDPTPMCELPEYCELLFDIDRNTAETRVTLVNY